MATVPWGCQFLSHHHMSWDVCGDLQCTVPLLTPHAGGMASCPDTIVMGCEFPEGISIIFTPSSATVAAVPTAGPGTEKPCTALTLLAWWHARHSLGMPWATCSLTWPARCQVCLGNLISLCPSWANSGRGAARLAAQQGRLPSLRSRGSGGLRGGPSHAARSPWELVSPALPSVGV